MECAQKQGTVLVNFLHIKILEVSEAETRGLHLCSHWQGHKPVTAQQDVRIQSRMRPEGSCSGDCMYCLSHSCLG